MVNAQVIADDVVISINPENPRANQNITLSLASSGIDLKNSDISWYVAGRLSKRGVGERSHTIAVSTLGSSLVVEAVIRTREGNTVRKQVSVRPAEVDLVFEALTYTPPFYKGKALYTPQSSVRITAMPTFIRSNGAKLTSKDLNYIWKKDFRVLGDSSGRGKDTLVLKGNVMLRPMTVTAEVSSPDGVLNAISSITLEPVNTDMALYIEDPIQGILYNRTVNETLKLEGEEMKLIAIPYFFSADKRSSKTLTYGWSINGEERTFDALNPSAITLRYEGEEAGDSAVKVSVENKREILQKAVRNINVFFGLKKASEI